jgi:hypothetical protein
MSVEQLESAIKALPPEERKRFAGWFDDHRHELIQRQEVEAGQQREVLLRRNETDTNAGSLESFAEADLDRMIRDATHAHAKKAPTRRG